MRRRMPRNERDWCLCTTHRRRLDADSPSTAENFHSRPPRQLPLRRGIPRKAMRRVKDGGKGSPRFWMRRCVCSYSSVFTCRVKYHHPIVRSGAVAPGDVSLTCVFHGRSAVVHISTIVRYTRRLVTGHRDHHQSRSISLFFRRTIRTSTMQNSVVEPASHKTDLTMAVLPSEFLDTIFSRKDWRGQRVEIQGARRTARRVSASSERIYLRGQGRESLRPFTTRPLCTAVFQTGTQFLLHSVISSSPLGEGDSGLKTDSHSIARRKYLRSGGTDLHFAGVGPDHGDSPGIDGCRMYDVAHPDLTTKRADRERRG